MHGKLLRFISKHSGYGLALNSVEILVASCVKWFNANSINPSDSDVIEKIVGVYGNVQAIKLAILTLMDKGVIEEIDSDVYKTYNGG